MTFPGLAPYFIAEPPSDAYRPLVIDDHGTDGIIMACDDSDSGLAEDAWEAAQAWYIRTYPMVVFTDPRNN